jgi:predicted amidohydrolase YtcJ
VPSSWNTSAGFNLHIHVIGDRALRTALDAIEAARLADGVTTTHDSLAHIQIADPSDVERVGRDHLYVAFTYSWMDTSPDYDVTVIPFLDKVSGNRYATLHPPGNFYDAHAYPVKSVQRAGGILAAGSDAPVGTRDPQPFVNMATAVTRAVGSEPPLAPEQRISIQDAIEAYTLGGARMLKLDGVAGSIEVGKSADFIELDQDILALADANRAADIANTQVLGTWFQGRRVYTAHH